MSFNGLSGTISIIRLDRKEKIVLLFTDNRHLHVYKELDPMWGGEVVLRQL